MSEHSNKASEEWTKQRLTAVFAAISLLAITVWGIFHAIGSYKTAANAEALSTAGTCITNGPITATMLFFKEALRSPFITVIFIFVIIAIMHHGAIGMKIIIEDYVKHKLCRMLLIKMSFLFANFVIAVVALTLVTEHVTLHVQEQSKQVITGGTNKE